MSKQCAHDNIFNLHIQSMNQEQKFLKIRFMYQNKHNIHMSSSLLTFHYILGPMSYL
jgi:hypothetical protein